MIPKNSSFYNLFKKSRFGLHNVRVQPILFGYFQTGTFWRRYLIGFRIEYALPIVGNSQAILQPSVGCFVEEIRGTLLIQCLSLHPLSYGAGGRIIAESRRRLAAASRCTVELRYLDIQDKP